MSKTTPGNKLNKSANASVTTKKPQVLQRKPITIGIVGLGRSGWDIHANRMRGDERFAITDVCDLDKARLKGVKQEFGCNTFTGLKDLLKNAECEMVVIASRSIDHGKQTIAAMKRKLRSLSSFFFRQRIKQRHIDEIIASSHFLLLQ